MKITATTGVYGIIGDPVDHSLSPVIQNGAFEALGLDFVYGAFPVKNVEAAVKGIRGLGLRGVNVTVPHKHAVMPFLDEIEDEARIIGAVNTVINENGRLKGYNTDAPGFMAALTKADGGVKGKQIVVLGAGGAARAVVYGLVQAGAHVTVLNRSQARAETLVEDVGGSAGELAMLSDVLPGADIVVNATTVGLHGTNVSPVPKELLRKELVVCDLVYDTQGTQLMHDAKAVSSITIPGTVMLLETAVLSFRIFTGVDAPREMMRIILEDVLSM